MKVLRTPDERFAALPGYNFAPHYTDITDDDGTALRIHHVDEGAPNAAPILLMHGEPSWSFLYRRMIAGLAARGHQVILASLGPGGSISPNNFIGPYGGTSSGTDVTGFFGVGYWAAEQDGTLKDWTAKIANLVGSSVDFHVYAGLTPSTLAFTGIILTVAASTYISTNTTDTLDIVAYECVAILNSDIFIGWSSGAMAVTALFTPKPL